MSTIAPTGRALPRIAVRRRAVDGDRRRERSITLLAALSWVGALIHVQAIPEHWTEYRPYAVAFGVLAILQAAWAVVYFRTPGERLLRAAAVVSLGVVAVWIASRTTGLPFGPEAGEAEAVGPADAAATLTELMLAGAAVSLVRRGGLADGTRIPGWLLPLGTAVLLIGGLGVVMGGH